MCSRVRARSRSGVGNHAKSKRLQPNLDFAADLGSAATHRDGLTRACLDSEAPAGRLYARGDRCPTPSRPKRFRRSLTPMVLSEEVVAAAVRRAPGDLDLSRLRSLGRIEIRGRDGEVEVFTLTSTNRVGESLASWAAALPQSAWHAPRPTRALPRDPALGWPRERVDPRPASTSAQALSPSRSSLAHGLNHARRPWRLWTTRFAPSRCPAAASCRHRTLVQ